MCSLLLSFIFLLLCADADLDCAEAISRQLLHTSQAAIKSRTPYPAELVKHKKELELQGMRSATATSTVSLGRVDADLSKTRS